jgi:hypothetical protein
VTGGAVNDIGAHATALRRKGRQVSIPIAHS